MKKKNEKPDKRKGWKSQRHFVEKSQKPIVDTFEPFEPPPAWKPEKKLSNTELEAIRIVQGRGGACYGD